MSLEEKEVLKKKREAVEYKNKGNEAYKAKDFEEALICYEEAIQRDPSELTYYTNKAAAYFEFN